MMERLTDCAQGYCEVYCKKYGHCFGDPGDCIFNDEVAMYEKLKAIEAAISADHLFELVRAEREGRLAMLTVNIGQKVWFLIEDLPCYYPDTNGWYLSEETVTAIAANGFSINKIGDDWDDWVWFIPFEKIGKTVFLTRQKAEAALEAQKGGAEDVRSNPNG